MVYQEKNLYNKLTHCGCNSNIARSLCSSSLCAELDSNSGIIYRELPNRITPYNIPYQRTTGYDFNQLDTLYPCNVKLTIEGFSNLESGYCLDCSSLNGDYFLRTASSTTTDGIYDYRFAPTSNAGANENSLCTFTNYYDKCTLTDATVYLEIDTTTALVAGSGTRNIYLYAYLNSSAIGRYLIHRKNVGTIQYLNNIAYNSNVKCMEWNNLLLEPYSGVSNNLCDINNVNFYITSINNLDSNYNYYITNNTQLAACIESGAENTINDYNVYTNSNLGFGTIIYGACNSPQVSTDNSEWRENVLIYGRPVGLSIDIDGASNIPSGCTECTELNREHILLTEPNIGSINNTYSKHLYKYNYTPDVYKPTIPLCCQPCENDDTICITKIQSHIFYNQSTFVFEEDVGYQSFMRVDIYGGFASDRLLARYTSETKAEDTNNCSTFEFNNFTYETGVAYHSTKNECDLTNLDIVVRPLTGSGIEEQINQCLGPPRSFDIQGEKWPDYVSVTFPGGNWVPGIAAMVTVSGCTLYEDCNPTPWLPNVPPFTYTGLGRQVTAINCASHSWTMPEGTYLLQRGLSYPTSSGCYQYKKCYNYDSWVYYEDNGICGFDIIQLSLNQDPPYSGSINFTVQVLGKMFDCPPGSFGTGCGGRTTIQDPSDPDNSYGGILWNFTGQTAWQNLLGPIIVPSTKYRYLDKNFIADLYSNMPGAETGSCSNYDSVNVHPIKWYPSGTPINIEAIW